MIIAIEGIDGAGKTSVAHELSKRIGFRVIEKALQGALSISKDAYISFRESLKSYTRENTNVMALFFMLNNAICAINSENVIADRFLMTNYYFYGREENKSLYKAFLETVYKPQYTVVLTADKDILIKRIRQRDLSKLDEEKELHKINQIVSFEEKVIPFLEESNLNYIVVNTSKRCVDETTNIILEQMNI